MENSSEILKKSKWKIPPSLDEGILRLYHEAGMEKPREGAVATGHEDSPAGGKESSAEHHGDQFCVTMIPADQASAPLVLWVKKVLWRDRFASVLRLDGHHFMQDCSTIGLRKLGNRVSTFDEENPKKFERRNCQTYTSKTVSCCSPIALH